jgi:hypothetical protein
MMVKAGFQIVLCAAAALKAAGLAPAGEPARPPVPRAAEKPPEAIPVLILPRAGLQGKSVKLPGGIVSLRQILQVLSDFTGLPVALEVKDGGPKRKSKAEIDLGVNGREGGGEEILLILEALQHRAWRDRLPGGREVIRVAEIPQPKLKKVFISQGSIRLADFARLLSDLTGFPLLLDSSDPGLAGREILIAADIPDADAEMVRAILEVNRVRNFEETLPSGKTVLRVESMAPAPVPEDPRPVPIIIVPAN